MTGKPRLDTRWPDCDEWPMARNAGGYGIRKFHGKSWLVHRAAWLEAYGDIPDGLDVLHKCDNPPCRNVSHLYLGTDADNGADKVRRGRARTGDKKGERNSIARLTDASVREIRRLYATGRYQQKEIASMFNVHSATIWYVVRRKTWDHVL